MAPHKKIRHLEFIDQIPKSPSGKILRRVLIERERAAALSGWHQWRPVILRDRGASRGSRIVTQPAARRRMR